MLQLLTPPVSTPTTLFVAASIRGLPEDPPWVEPWVHMTCTHISPVSLPSQLEICQSKFFCNACIGKPVARSAHQDWNTHWLLRGLKDVDVGVCLKVGFRGGLHFSWGKDDGREAGGYPAVSSTCIKSSVVAQGACSITHAITLHRHAVDFHCRQLTPQRGRRVVRAHEPFVKDIFFALPWG